MPFSSSVFEPLAYRYRPTTIEHFVGQEHLTGTGKIIQQMLLNGNIHSMILWGPPGCGKTTLAHIIAQSISAHYEPLSAISSGIANIRQIVEQSIKRQQEENKNTVVFIDEIHRFSKNQQDALLPYVENGTFVLVGATTENPSFCLNNALLSRTKIYILQPITKENLSKLLDRTLKSCEKEQNKQINMSQTAKNIWISIADGDARKLLNFVELALETSNDNTEQVITISQEVANTIAQNTLRFFDKDGDYFYDIASALHKSIRGSNPDASLYWLTRGLTQGVDPLYVARRLLRIASEDIGLADLNALQVCNNAIQTYERLGSPEGELALAQATVYLAIAPKSNAVYRAYQSAVKQVEKHGNAAIPIHLKNAPTKLLKNMGHGKNYRYPHDEPYAYSAKEQYFPDSVPKQKHYTPTDRGLEKKIKVKLEFLAKLDSDFTC